MTPAQIHKRHDELHASKSELEYLMDQIDEFFAPNDRIYSNRQQVSRAGGEKGELLDITSTLLIDEYVSTVLGLYFNPETAWFRCEFPTLDVGEKDARAMDARTRLLFKLITRSNYYSVAPQLEKDVLVHGHGLLIIEKDKDSFARCYTKHPQNLYFVESEEHELIEMYWSTDFSQASFIAKYPDMGYVVKSDDLKSSFDSPNIRVIYALHPNKPPYNENIDVKGANIFRSIMVSGNNSLSSFTGAGVKHIDKDSTGTQEIGEPLGISSNRFIGSRNVPARGHAYGDGVGKKVLIKSRILNRLARDIIIASRRQADPTTAVDESLKSQMKNKTRLEGGELLFKQNDLFTGRDMKALETLEIRSDLNAIISAYQLQQEQLANLLPTTSQTYKVSRQSVQEIQQRLRDQDKRLNPIRAHYLKEGVSKHLRRFYEIAKEGKYFDGEEFAFSDPALEKMTPRINFDALMLQAHRMSKALQVLQAVGQSQNLVTMQPQLMTRIDGVSILKAIFAGNNATKHLVPEEAAQQAEQRMIDQNNQQQEAQQEAVSAKGLQQSSDAFKNILGVLGDEG